MAYDTVMELMHLLFYNERTIDRMIMEIRCMEHFTTVLRFGLNGFNH